jgi:hypothetical protein
VSAVLAWEVDYPDGSVLYRGTDIELAEELYYAAPTGSHLVPAGPETPGTPGPLLPGGDR